jgi:hypothetical protein
MGKVVLVLDYMPKNCRECILSTLKRYGEDFECERWVCAAFDTKMFVDINAEKRAEFCPLKEI